MAQKVVAVGVIALIVGIALGYGFTSVQISSLQSQVHSLEDQLASLQASKTSTPTRISLMPEAGQKAQGWALFSRSPDGTEVIVIQLTNLEPKGTYTIWFANQPAGSETASEGTATETAHEGTASESSGGPSMMGVGAQPYDFTANNEGVGTYYAELGSHKHWQMLVIAYHASGDPTDMHMQPVCGGMVPEGF